jgi:hypothetical protein
MRRERLLCDERCSGQLTFSFTGVSVRRRIEERVVFSLVARACLGEEGVSLMTNRRKSQRQLG